MAGLVLVMGVSGSGKSTVAQSLARRLEVPFGEGDDAHPPQNRAKMAAGQPLDDADRAPWLGDLADWLGSHRERGAVLACSALRRRYRDVLRRQARELEVIHLTGSAELLAARLRSRSGHFMPSSLLVSQLATLEPLEADERGIALDAAASVGQIVGDAATYLARA